METILTFLETHHESIDIILKVIAGIGAVVGFILGRRAYEAQSRLARFEKFSEMQRRFDEDKDFSSIVSLIEKIAPGNERSINDQIAQISQTKRAAFLGFFEDVGIMMNSDLIKPEVAFNTWGYWALRAHDTRGLWAGMDSPADKKLYWAVFNDFVAKMREHEKLRHAKDGRFELDFSI